jgi:nicotinate-nucleotide--dimethylbenzimidazole phosphoribosyltransferase
MVYNLLREGAGINVLARHVGAKVIVADLGVKTPIEKNENLNFANFRDKKVTSGTKNFSKEPAMTKEQAFQAIESGIEIFEDEFKNGIDIVATGEMGIGNTTPASAITSAITNIPAKEVTGRGTGINDEALIFKIETIEKALNINKPNPQDGIDILSKVGGLEIGGLAGVILTAASRRVPVVIDGFISGSAALIAYTIEPKVKDYMLGSHNSVEKGHRAIMDFIGLKPLFDFNLRLGEGTGACLAMGIIEASVKILTEMATFQNAGVSEKNS